MQKREFKLFAAIVVLMFVAGGVAQAGTKTFKFSGSGTGVDVPIGATGVLMLLALNLLTAGVAPGGRAANAQLH